MELAGYVVLRAPGETFVGAIVTHPFRPWRLLVIPAAITRSSWLPPGWSMAALEFA